MPINESFDDTSEEIIRASDLLAPVPDFPQTAIVTFDVKTFDLMNDEYDIRPLAALVNAASSVSVFCLNDGERRFATCVSPVGAPAAVGIVEELAALGARRFVFFGSCGVLDSSIDAGRLIVPTAAWRDEGTSYHYAPAGDWVEVASAPATQEILRAAGVGFVAGRVWTTDAFYRETRAVMERRREAGCIAVDMECSGLAAAAAWRGLDVYQFLYAADNVDAAAWDRRILGALPAEPRLAHARVALEIARRLTTGGSRAGSRRQ